MKKLMYCIVLLLMLTLSACSGNTEPANDISIAIALTQTAAIPAVENAVPQQEQPQNTSEVVPPQAEEAVTREEFRIEFPIGKTIWYTNGDVNPGETNRLILKGITGQQVSIWLTPDADPLAAVLNISSADGTPYSFSPEVYWSNVITSNQDYYIDITSLWNENVTYQIIVEVSPTTIDPANAAMYDLIPDPLCEDLGSIASQTLGINFTAYTRAPFFDGIGGEAGQGCSLRSGGNGTQFSSPQDVVSQLSNSVGAGWNEIPTYVADGPNGSMIGLSRDMGLMLISAQMEPAMGVICDPEQPISACNLSPDQVVYIIQIDIAQYKATFSLDGHWVDASSGFTLDLYQDWKTIYGSHIYVADNGNKIDSLDDSIHGMLTGNVVNVNFQSSFTANQGVAQITYLDPNTIQWNIITAPDGEYYLPMSAILTR